MPDTTGYDLWPLVTRYAEEYGLPATLLLAMLKAESGLNPYAERWGKGLDVSFGLAQLIVATANSYGITGDAYAVREALFDRETSIRLGARHLATCYSSAGGDWLQALIIYNSGMMHEPGDWYWTVYAANIAAYRQAIEWARGVTDTG